MSGLRGKWRHWVWWGDGCTFDVVCADSPPSLSDDGFDTRTEALEFVIKSLASKRAETNEQIRRARVMLRREKLMEGL